MSIVLCCLTCRADPTFKGNYLIAAQRAEVVVDWLVDHITHSVEVLDSVDNPTIQHRLDNLRESWASTSLDATVDEPSLSARKVAARYALLEIDVTEMLRAALDNVMNEE